MKTPIVRFFCQKSLSYRECSGFAAVAFRISVTKISEGMYDEGQTLAFQIMKMRRSPQSNFFGVYITQSNLFVAVR